MRLIYEREDWKRLIDRVMDDDCRDEWLDSTGIVCKDPADPDTISVVFDDPNDAVLWQLKWH
jgi:hypothetical protein